MKHYLLAICTILFLSGCVESNTTNESKGEVSEAAGGRYYGGVFKFNEVRHE